MVLCPPIEETALLSAPNLQQLPTLTNAPIIGTVCNCLRNVVEFSPFCVLLAIDDFNGLSGPTISCKLLAYIQ